MLRPRAVQVTPITDYQLLVRFDTGETRRFDVKPYITGGWFGKLRDTDVFNTARIGEYTVEWPDGQDVAPHCLYDDSIPVDP
jgi:hypothetical protein